MTKYYNASVVVVEYPSYPVPRYSNITEFLTQVGLAPLFAQMSSVDTMIKIILN